jgi:hypothetical protein
VTPRLATPPKIRIRPAPPCDPPYDDERHPEEQEWTILAPPLWDLAPAQEPRARPPAAVERRARPAGVPAEIRMTAAVFVKTCLEVVNGLRPIGQLRALADPQDAATVLSAMTRATRRLQREARRRPPAAGGGTTKIKLRRVRVYQPHPDAIEIAAVIGTDERSWAAALRLRRRGGRWLCAAAAVL